MKHNYIIVFDTNNLFYPERDNFEIIFHPRLDKFLSFLEDKKIRKNIKVCIPKIVVEERITQRVEEIKETLSKLSEKKEALKKFVKVNFVDEKNSDLRKKYEKIVEDYIKREGIIVFKYPKIEQKIIDEAVQRKPPFKTFGRGFKDKIVWESIKENAKKNKGNYLFITNDGDFKFASIKKEFAKISQKPFKILKNIPELEEFLDNSLSLGLNLRKQHEKIKKDIKDNLNNILYQLYGKKVYMRFKPQSLGGIDIKELNFLSISKNGIIIDLEIKGKAKFFKLPEEENENNFFGSYEVSTPEEIRPHTYYSSWFFKQDFSERKVIIKINLQKLEESFKVNEINVHEDYD